MITRDRSMTQPDNSQSPHDKVFEQSSEISENKPQPPNQPSPSTPKSGDSSLPDKARDKHDSQSKALNNSQSNDPPFEQRSRLTIYVLIVVAFAAGMGATWIHMNVGQAIVPAPMSEMQARPREKSLVNQGDATIATKKISKGEKMPILMQSTSQNLAAVSERYQVDSRTNILSAASHFNLIDDRLARLDEEFSRFKIDIIDLRNTEELRNQHVTSSTAWSTAMSIGQLMLRASADEHNKNNIPLVFVPAGHFWMGQSDAQRGESARASSAAHYDFSHPAHSVHVQSGYFIGVYEITVGQLEEFAELQATGEATLSTHRFSKEIDRNKPACNIDWRTAMQFCEWLSQINNIQVRLPTEIEWEYAARGNKYVQQLEPLREQDVVVGGPWAVDTAALDRSWCGCVAMNNNVQEWTIDVWDEKVYGKRDTMLKSSRPNSSFPYSGIESNVMNPSNEPRAVRGSSFQDIPANRVLAIRRFKPISVREETLGFRIVVPVVNAKSTGK
jgi:formylglycine-generating enzyme required for sulfatase activity